MSGRSSSTLAKFTEVDMLKYKVEVLEKRLENMEKHMDTIMTLLLNKQIPAPVEVPRRLSTEQPKEFTPCAKTEEPTSSFNLLSTGRRRTIV